MLSHTHLETYGWLTSGVATDVLIIKHQIISIQGGANHLYEIGPMQLHAKILYLQQTKAETKVTFWRTWHSYSMVEGVVPLSGGMSDLKWGSCNNIWFHSGRCSLYNLVADTSLCPTPNEKCKCSQISNIMTYISTFIHSGMNGMAANLQTMWLFRFCLIYIKYVLQGRIDGEQHWFA